MEPFVSASTRPPCDQHRAGGVVQVVRAAVQLVGRHDKGDQLGLQHLKRASGGWCAKATVSERSLF